MFGFYQQFIFFALFFTPLSPFYSVTVVSFVIMENIILTKLNPASFQIVSLVVESLTCHLE